MGPTGSPAAAQEAPARKAEQAPSAQDVFEMVELDPGVWAAVVRPEAPVYAFANSLVVLSAEGVLVVDTQQSTTAARALIREIRARTDAPVRWVVHTHWHGDHVLGNQAYREAFPDVAFVAHEATREAVDTRGRTQLRELLESLPGRIAQREAWLETGEGPGGEPLTEAQTASVRRSRDINRAYLAELRETELILPDVTFRDRLTLPVGERRVELLHMGPAHTRGDLVVHLPGAGILAVGDLIEGALPYLEDGDLAGWAEALARLREVGAETVVGAHAAPGEGAGLLAWQADFFRALVDRAGAVRARGLSRAEAADEVTMDDFRDEFEGLGVGEEAYREWVRSAVEMAWEQAEETPGSSPD